MPGLGCSGNAEFTAAGAQGAGGDADPELSRLQSARRILLHLGIVLGGDPRVGGFAAADILIENGTTARCDAAVFF